MHDEFISAMCAAGLAPVKPPRFVEGRLERFRVEGDKAGSLNGWAVAHFSPVRVLVFGSWKTGEKHTWHANGDKPSPAEAEALRKQLAAVRAQHAEEQAKVRAKAAAKAATLWAGARPALDRHPYLVRKNVPAFGLRALGEQLLIPLRDEAGCIYSLQFIQPDGTKRFLTGGRIVGCYFSIGRLTVNDNALLLCEGYTTAASVHMATGRPTAVAFNAGNLKPVALALRAKLPRLRLVICADDDAQTPGNPGLRFAREAAEAVDGVMVSPVFQ